MVLESNSFSNTMILSYAAKYASGFYGPYREADLPLSPSNAAFDESLKARNPSWGLRAREDVEDLARSQGLVATRRVQMPSNNLMLLFRRA